MPRVTALVLWLSLFGGLAWAQSKSFGDYEVHHAAFRADELTAQVAAQYGITRSRKHAVVLVNVQKNGKPASARVTGKLRSLPGRQQELVFLAARQQDSIDYLAEVPIDHAALAIFDLEVLPPDQRTPLRLQFQKTFYTDK